MAIISYILPQPVKFTITCRLLHTSVEDLPGTSFMKLPQEITHRL